MRAGASSEDSAAGQGRGACQTGDELASENNTTRGSFNGLSSTGLTSANHTSSAVMPYVYSFGGKAAGGYNTRGSLASGEQAESSSYQGSSSDVVYTPFGEVRSGEKSALTDFAYTVQKHDDSTGGPMYYGANTAWSN